MTPSCEPTGSRLKCREEAFLGTTALFIVFAFIFFIGHHPIPADAAQASASEASARYLSPVALQLSPNGQRLYVVCEDSDTVLAVNTLTRQVIGRADVGKRPKGIAISPDGRTLADVIGCCDCAAHSAYSFGSARIPWLRPCAVATQMSSP
jgi:YVTN family beta-propeller protein